MRPRDGGRSGHPCGMGAARARLAHRRVPHAAGDGRGLQLQAMDGGGAVSPLVSRHVWWWARHLSVSIPHRDDLAQEAALAEWRARFDFDESRRVKFETFAWRRMYGACRAYLQAAGVLRWTQGANRARRPVAVVSMEMVEVGHHDAPDGPLALKEAWTLLRGGYVARGCTTGQAEALAWLDLGATLAEAGEAAGISRQRVHQLAQRHGVAAPNARAA